MKNQLARTIAMIALVFAAFPAPGKAQTKIAGDWQGSLDVGGAQLHLLLHISAAQGGSLTATLDSIDQGALGIPVTAVTLKDSKLNLTVDSIHGSYEGTVNKDGTKIEGAWTQGPPLELNFERVKAQTQAAPSEIDGVWQGTLDAGALKLRILFKIISTPDGLKAQTQSPDQNPVWISASSVTRDGSSLTITLKELDASFDGKISADLNSIDGKLTQRDNPLPLLLKRVKDLAANEPRRPQNPVKPYPYGEEEVTYANKASGNTLGATLTIPPGKGPFPAVLLIVGSGPHDRDESLMGHKPFLVLADYLTRQGIVVLRADKRGVGVSTGDAIAATTADYATDAEAGVAYLKTRPEVNPRKIGLIGHSEGGVIAPMVAARNKDVAFIVMMAGTGVPGDQILVEQARLISLAGGIGKEKADQNAANEQAILTLLETEKDAAALDRKLHEKMAAEGVPEGQIGASIHVATGPWFRYFISYDPASALRRVKCPVLAINGSLDLQVPPVQNLPAIRKALQEAGNNHVEVDELPGLNHLFQTAKTGAPSEYGQIVETIAPVALDKMAGWILKQ
jgi:fermentation-respiration switch protein FrsA (DUF1100 family)